MTYIYMYMGAHSQNDLSVSGHYLSSTLHRIVVFDRDDAEDGMEVCS